MSTQFNGNFDDDLKTVALKGDYERTKALIESGADFRYDDDEILVKTAQRGHTEIVKLLLDHGANVHAQNGNALSLASVNNHVETMKCLIENGADIRTDTELLMWTANHGQTDAVRLLLELGLDCKHNDDPIINAAYGGHKETVKLLLDYGADFKARDNEIIVHSGLDMGFIKEVALEYNIVYSHNFKKSLSFDPQYSHIVKALDDIDLYRKFSQRANKPQAQVKDKSHKMKI